MLLLFSKSHRLLMFLCRTFLFFFAKKKVYNTMCFIFHTLYYAPSLFELFLVFCYTELMSTLIKCYSKPDAIAVTARTVAVTAPRWGVATMVAARATTRSTRIARVRSIFKCPFPYISCYIIYSLFTKCFTRSC